MAISVQQLFRAIQASDFEAAKRAFNLNPSLVHAKHPRDSHTALHAAAALGNLQLLRDLLHQGASCQALDCNNETPLHVASRQVGTYFGVNGLGRGWPMFCDTQLVTKVVSTMFTCCICCRSHCAGPRGSGARAADRCRAPLLCEVHQQRRRHATAPGCGGWAC